MNNQLHHMWNSGRDTTRGSCEEKEQVLVQEKLENKITLRHTSTDTKKRNV
jgi:hypothetical protein